jgi:uncharacterized protein YlxW (UPF0749 family)
MNLALTTVAVAITLAVMTYLGGMETSLHAQFRDDDAKLNNGEKLAVVDMQMRSVQADVASMRSDMRNVQEEVRQLRQIAAVRDGQLQLVQQTLGFLGIAGCIQIGLLLFKIFGNSKPAP